MIIISELNTRTESCFQADFPIREASAQPGSPAVEWSDRVCWVVGIDYLRLARHWVHVWHDLVWLGDETNDCLMHWFCVVCAISQEAREIKTRKIEASRRGLPFN